MISVATSVVTLLGMWLVARKDWRGWLVGLINQLLWLALIIQTHAWGLLILSVSLSWIYARALITWRREAAARGAFHAPGFSGDAHAAALEQAEMLLDRWQTWSIDMGRPPTMSASEWRGLQLRTGTLQRRLFAECRQTGWDPDLRNSLAEELAHIHEEVSEAFRAWRLYHDAEVHHDADGKPQGVPIEFADVLIGLFYNAELHGFDLLSAVEEKHRYNLTRDYVAEGRQLHSGAS